MTVAVLPATGVMLVSGAHWYVPPVGAPVAVSIDVFPAQMLVSGEDMLTVAVELIVSTIESSALHPVTLSVTVSLYVVVPAVGVAIVGLAAVVLLSPVAGVHAYV